MHTALKVIKLAFVDREIDGEAHSLLVHAQFLLCLATRMIVLSGGFSKLWFALSVPVRMNFIRLCAQFATGSIGEAACQLLRGYNCQKSTEEERGWQILRSSYG
jgi:hypothetical protein